MNGTFSASWLAMIHLRAAKEVKHIEDLDCNFFVASSVRPENNGILLLKIVKCLKSFVPSRQFHLNPSRTSLPINFVSVTVHCAASEILKFAHDRQN